MNHSPASPIPRSVGLLSSGPPISLKVLYCLKQLNIATDVIDIGTSSAARYSRYRRDYVQIPMPLPGGQESMDAFAEALSSYLLKKKVEGVIGGDMASTGILHAVRDHLINIKVFPTSSAELLDLLDNKWRFQEFMVAHDIPCPRTILLENLANWETAAMSIGYPLIVKPLFGESGHGIITAHKPSELNAHLHSGSKYARLPLLFQAFAPGADADISILAQDGRIICHVVQIRENGCTLRFVEHFKALEIAQKIMSPTNYTGIANIDIRIASGTGNVSVLECNPRFWYTLQASMWRGMNFVEAGYRMLAGEKHQPYFLANGEYHLHGCLLKKFIWKPMRWKSIAPYNWKGLAQALSDPAPYLLSKN